MDELNPRSKVYELKKQRKEELESKNPLKGEELLEYSNLENELSKFEYQRFRLHKEYEKHLKQEERNRRINEEEVENQSATSLGSLLDLLIEKNEQKSNKIDFLCKILAVSVEDEANLDPHVDQLAREAQFFRLSMARNMLENGYLDQKMLKIAQLEDEIEHVRMRIGQEENLVDGMNYKIFVLNDDIVAAADPETQTEADPKPFLDARSAHQQRQATGDHVHQPEERKHVARPRVPKKKTQRVHGQGQPAEQRPNRGRQRPQESHEQVLRRSDRKPLQVRDLLRREATAGRNPQHKHAEQQQERQRQLARQRARQVAAAPPQQLRRAQTTAQRGKRNRDPPQVHLRPQRSLLPAHPRLGRKSKDRAAPQDQRIAQVARLGEVSIEAVSSRHAQRHDPPPQRARLTASESSRDRTCERSRWQAARRRPSGRQAVLRVGQHEEVEQRDRDRADPQLLRRRHRSHPRTHSFGPRRAPAALHREALPAALGLQHGAVQERPAQALPHETRRSHRPRRNRPPAKDRRHQIKDQRLRSRPAPATGEARARKQLHPVPHRSLHQALHIPQVPSSHPG